MGLQTLSEFRDDLAENLAGQNVNPARLARFVNTACLEIATDQLFPELLSRVPFNVFAGIDEYAEPSDIIGIKTLMIEGTLMRRMERQFSEQDVTDKKPSHYMRRDDKIVIWTEPNKDYTGYMEYYRTPVALSADGDTSQFASYWDQAIVILATAGAWFAAKEYDVAEQLRERYHRFEKNRITERDVSKDAPQAGLQVAWDYTDLTDNPPHV